MKITAKMSDIQDRQGWRNSTVYSMALDFIEENGLTADFEEFLLARSEEENDEVDEDD